MCTRACRHSLCFRLVLRDSLLIIRTKYENPAHGAPDGQEAGGGTVIRESLACDGKDRPGTSGSILLYFYCDLTIIIGNRT
jgi:hypothetical protein